LRVSCAPSVVGSVSDGVGERHARPRGHEVPGLLDLADLVAFLRLLDEIERKRSLAVGDLRKMRRPK
jgi:hypothetical protein